MSILDGIPQDVLDEIDKRLEEIYDNLKNYFTRDVFPVGNKTSDQKALEAIHMLFWKKYPRENSF